jgi:hypothetical protein
MKISFQQNQIFFISGFIFILNSCRISIAQTPSSEPYNWESVQMVGGGFVDRIVFHPTAKGVCYCQTYMGGAYRRNQETLRWNPWNFPFNG